MRTKLRIIDDLCKYNLRHHLGIFLEKNLIEFVYYKHDTGRQLDIYLKKENKILHVYHDNEWFCSRYNFNDEGQTFGYLIKGPWIKVIDDLFVKFEEEILKKQSELINKKIEHKLEQKEKEQQNIEYFKNLF